MGSDMMPDGGFRNVIDRIVSILQGILLLLTRAEGVDKPVVSLHVLRMNKGAGVFKRQSFFALRRQVVTMEIVELIVLKVQVGYGQFTHVE